MELLVKLGVNQASLNNTLSAIGSKLSGLLTVSAFSIAARKTAEYADTIEETSTRLGVSTGKLQEWLYAAKQTGAGAERLTTFIERLTAAAQDASKVELFKKMGISPTGMTPAQLFSSVSGWAGGKSQTEIIGALEPIVSIRQIGPMINLLQSDLEGLGKTARDVGAVMDESVLHQLAVLNDQFSVLSQILMTQFGPALLKSAQWLLMTFGGLKGASSGAGAITAGIDLSPKATAARMMNPLIAIRDIVRAVRDPNLESFKQTAGNVFSEEIDSIEKMIQNFARYSAPGAPIIGSPEAKADKDKKSAAEKGASPFGFEADNLAKAGLFAGSSLLFNPNLTVQREQLDVLRRIQENTARNKGIF